MNIENNLLMFIEQLNKVNYRKNIFYESSQDKHFLLGNYAVDYIISHRQEFIDYFNFTDKLQRKKFIGVVAEYSTKTIIETIFKLNQYVEITDKLRNRMNNLYRNFMETIFNRLSSNQAIGLNWLNGLVIEHQVQLREILNDIEELKIFPREKKIVDEIPCSEYRAVFQLDILGINIEEMCEPVLDIGCGSSARLVQYLHEQGIETYGIDRNVEKKPYVIEIDWFKFKLKPNYWGTIISHLSFTNHFKRTHFKMNGNYINYARRYMELLNSLKSGGSFFYTPDLPFVEQFLSPDLYLVNKKNIGKERLNFVKSENDFSIYSVQVKKTNND
ncbi:hypothetical protein GM661_11805 [Iocasia frigidifontis]|uniref:Uncharacterized protein n=1 Tax=Iocasia fonsfrigidae TaxID=2682810 RepID=A0A8A7KFX0_9FIRM|nr:hypothetical protein [Iocasia fonsfrigidae]QTL98598.1 hypothetical protein GM661_11805 [Iocasia fonsfrigidae]